MPVSVSFSDLNPDDHEYFEEYNKFNKFNVWFTLIYIFRTLVAFSAGMQVTPMEYTNTVKYLFNHSSIKHTSLELDNEVFLYKCKCSRKGYAEKLNINDTAECFKQSFIFATRTSKYIGFTIGSIFAGVLADLYGRRPVSIITSLLWFITSLIFPFLKNPKVLQILYGICSSFCGATFVVTYVNIAEIFNKTQRFFTIFTNITYLFGSILIIVLMKFLTHWKYINLFVASVVLLVPFGCWYTPESPRWLFNKIKIKKAFKDLIEVTGMTLEVSYYEDNDQENSTIFVQMIWFLCRRKNLFRFGIILFLCTTCTLIFAFARWHIILEDFKRKEIGTLSATTEIASYLFVITVYLPLGKRYGLVLLYLLLIIQKLTELTTTADAEYFEVYNKYNLINPWFILIYILRCTVPFWLAIQLGPFDYLSSEYLQEFLLRKENKTVSGLFYSSSCEDVKAKHQIYQVLKNRCSQEHLAIEMGISKGLGWSVGSLLGGLLADLFGRRIVALIFSSLWAILAYTVIFVPNGLTLQVLCIVVSSFCRAVDVITYTNFGELANRSNRVINIYSMLWLSVGGLVLRSMIQEIESWRYMSTFIAFSTLCVLFACWYTPESPRWLLNKNKRIKAFEELEQLTELVLDYRDVVEEVHPEIPVVVEKRNIFKTLKAMMYFLVKKKLKNFFVILMLMSTSTLFYNTGRWWLYINFIYTKQLGWLSFLIEIASYLFITPIYFFLGKRYSLLFTYILTAMGSLAALISNDAEAKIYYSVFKILFGLSSMNLMIAYVLEVFPTFLRSTMIGFYFTVFGIMSIMSILLIDKEIDHFNYSLGLFLMSLLGSAVLALPGTSKQDLPNFKLDV